MHLVEIYANCFLSKELFKKYIKEFDKIFNSGLNDPNGRMKVSTLKATSSILTTFEDKDDI